MYNYKWDAETGGYILDMRVSGISKEVRPVFTEELKFLEMDKKYGWDIPECAEPLMWAEARRYIYRGELVAEAVGGGLYSMPEMRNVVSGLKIQPVDIRAMTAKNENIMNGFVQKTLMDIYSFYESYKNKVDMFYVAFSGGKDSVVMLDLVQRALPHDAFDVIFGDTTMELSDTYKNVEDSKKFWQHLRWHTAKANFDALDLWKLVGPPSRTIRWCCGVHKSAPSVLKTKEIVAGRRGCKVNELKNFKVAAFVGIRKEESEARSTYPFISDGNKHPVQINCHPILQWSSPELFMYYLSRNLPLNEIYRKGTHRVGCLLCPMSANWYECIINHNYSAEVKPYIDIIKDSMRKDFTNEDEWQNYLSEGGWKQRSSGKMLKNSENKIVKIISQNEEKYIIKGANYSWKKWMSALGDVIEIGTNKYSIQHGNVILNFNAETDGDVTTIWFEPLPKSKSTIRFMYLFKNVLNKSAYCINCGECMADCPNGALSITKNEIEINNCIHCGQCLDRQRGCIAAKSKITTGDTNMSTKNIDRYKNFGLRQEWIEIYLENPDKFWENDRLGTHMFKSYEKWGREAGIIDSGKAPLPIVSKLAELGADSSKLWGYIFANIAYNSAIVNWYIRHIEIGQICQVSDMIIMLGDNYSITTKKNALSSLKDTMKSSPIGDVLGQGECEMKGRSVVSLTRTGWHDPDPIVMLYTLYLFAEHSDDVYSFTLTDLEEDKEEREEMSPNLIFGVNAYTLRPILQGLSHDYPAFIQVDFNHNLMENIFLSRDKTSADVAELL